MARRRHRSSHRRRPSSKNILNKSVSVVKTTSRKYMPKVKHGLENVGSNVITRGQQSIPFLQRMTRKIFGAFGSKSKKHRRH